MVDQYTEPWDCVTCCQAHTSAAPNPHGDPPLLEATGGPFGATLEYSILVRLDLDNLLFPITGKSLEIFDIRPVFLHLIILHFWFPR